MLIVNDTHRLLAGVASLNESCPYCCQPLRDYPLICPYCCQPLRDYPLIMCDDAAQTVYHVTCAVELATDILVDLFTFLSPPPPYERFFVLAPLNAAPSQQTKGESR